MAAFSGIRSEGCWVLVLSLLTVPVRRSLEEFCKGQSKSERAAIRKPIIGCSSWVAAQTDRWLVKTYWCSYRLKRPTSTDSRPQRKQHQTFIVQYWICFHKKFWIWSHAHDPAVFTVFMNFLLCYISSNNCGWKNTRAAMFGSGAFRFTDPTERNPLFSAPPCGGPGSGSAAGNKSPVSRALFLFSCFLLLCFSFRWRLPQSFICRPKDYELLLYAIARWIPVWTLCVHTQRSHPPPAVVWHCITVQTFLF